MKQRPYRSSPHGIIRDVKCILHDRNKFRITPIPHDTTGHSSSIRSLKILNFYTEAVNPYMILAAADTTYDSSHGESRAAKMSPALPVEV
jgi:hypothetical protein